jgi:hypothetical protein
MSRHSPTGFAFSMLFEIAAVVIIVSLLPRIDLRPAATAQAAGGGSPEMGPALASLLQLTERTRSDSPPPAPFAWATEPARFSLPATPPLIERQPLPPRYVEERLDRASQQLVNSVGSAVVQATGDLFAAAPPPTPPPAALNHAPFVPTGQLVPERRVTLLPPSGNTTPPAPAGSFPTQPRPWIRY